MSVGCVDHHGVYSGCHKSLDSLHSVGGHADTGSHPQASLLILAGVGVILYLGDVAIGDQSDKMSVGIHHREFLDLMLQQYLRGMLETGIGSGHQIFGSHYFTYRYRHIFLESQVAVGDNAYEPVVAIHHRDTADMVFLHELQRVAYRAVAGDGDRVIDHTALSSLDLTHLSGLLGNRHILVYHADTPLSGHSDRHR